MSSHIYEAYPQYIIYFEFVMITYKFYILDKRLFEFANRILLILSFLC